LPATPSARISTSEMRWWSGTWPLDTPCLHLATRHCQCSSGADSPGHLGLWCCICR
jgi:hypothetical protein